LNLSVVIPTYQSASHIKYTVEEIYSQLSNSIKTDFEIIVVEDGSNDDTLQILNSLNLDCLRIIKNPKNLGQAVSTTLGIKKCRGDIIITYDDDMKYPIEAIADLYFKYHAYRTQQCIIYGFIKSPFLSDFFRRLTDWMAGKPFATSFRCFSKSLVIDMPHEQIEVLLFNNYPELEIRYIEFPSQADLTSRTSFLNRLVFILFMFPKFDRSKLNILLNNWFYLVSATLVLTFLLLKEHLLLVSLLVLIIYFLLLILKQAGRQADPFKTKDLFD
jgi:glycosyltransferase involved in cell wall biosynthesis